MLHESASSLGPHAFGLPVIGFVSRRLPDTRSAHAATDPPVPLNALAVPPIAARPASTAAKMTSRLLTGVLP
jgi:hypothetical protein